MLSETTEVMTSRDEAFDLKANGGLGIMSNGAGGNNKMLMLAVAELFSDADHDQPVAGRFYLAAGNRFTGDTLARRVQGNVVLAYPGTVEFDDGQQLELAPGTFLAAYR